MSQPRTIHAIAITVACILVVIAPTLAQSHGGSENHGFGGLRGLGSFGGLGGSGGPGGLGGSLGFDIPCLSSVKSAPGCIEELISVFLSGQGSLPGPVCCKAILEVEDKCWPKVFPSNPLLPILLKNICAAPAPQLSGAPPPAVLE